MRDDEVGRSMIEMLGVLAIVGILSVGGIAGLSKAMMKYKLNRLTEEYTLFINELLRYENDFIKEKQQKKQDTSLILTSYIEPLGILPQGWKISFPYVYDSMTNRISPTIWHETSLSGIRHNKPMITYTIKQQDNEQNNSSICQHLFVHIVKPYSELITVATVWGKDTEEIAASSDFWYGDHYCTKNRKCIQNITLSQIYDSCTVCIKENSNCTLLIGFE